MCVYIYIERDRERERERERDLIVSARASDKSKACKAPQGNERGARGSENPPA